MFCPLYLRIVSGVAVKRSRNCCPVSSVVFRDLDLSIVINVHRGKPLPPRKGKLFNYSSIGREVYDRTGQKRVFIVVIATDPAASVLIPVSTKRVLIFVIHYIAVNEGGIRARPGPRLARLRVLEQFFICFY